MCAWAFCALWPLRHGVAGGCFLPLGRAWETRLRWPVPDPENPVVFELRRRQAVVAPRTQQQGLVSEITEKLWRLAMLLLSTPWNPPVLGDKKGEIIGVTPSDSRSVPLHRDPVPTSALCAGVLPLHRPGRPEWPPLPSPDTSARRGRSRCTDSLRPRADGQQSPALRRW